MMNLQMLMSMMQNPMSIVQKRFNIPQGMNNPETMVNHLIQSGQIRQQDVDVIRNNPMFQQFFKK